MKEAQSSISKIDAIILVGGFGTRLKEVVSDVPKPLAKINGKPFLQLLLEKLASFGTIERVILAAGYKACALEAHFEQHPASLPLLFSIEKEPLGTGGALRKALALVKTPHVLAMNGDTWLDFSFADFFQHHQNLGAKMTLALHPTKGEDRFGGVEFDHKSFIIKAFKEKAAGCTWANAGVYLMERDFLDETPLEKSFSLEREAFPRLLKKGIFGYPCTSTFIDIGTKDSYFEAQDLLKHEK